MPHQCTTCGRTFPDGSKEMLSGCPDCGGNKFQFKPKGASTSEEPSTGTEPSTGAKPSTGEQPTPSDADHQTTPDEPSPSEESPSPEKSASSQTESLNENPSAKPANSTVKSAEQTADPDTDSTTPDTDSTTPDTDSTTPDTDSSTADTEHIRERTAEDTAQASARSDVVSPDELDQASRDIEQSSDPDSSDPDTPEGSRPDIGELRDELNEQFESIRIVSPGKYELNLMELYERQEYIISLQEDGRYVIEMPDAWGIEDE